MILLLPAPARHRPACRQVGVRALLVLIVLPLLVSGPLSWPASAAVTDAPAPLPRGEGAWTWPLWPQPPVEQFFDAPDGPYAAGHRGVDLLGRSGQAVRAVEEGTVAYAGRVGGIGVVSLDTAAGRVTYQPVSASVQRGAVVHAGKVLGHLLTTGGHCQPRACLHLGLIVQGEYQDPLRLLGGAPVRLLPLDAAPRQSALRQSAPRQSALRSPMAAATPPLGGHLATSRSVRSPASPGDPASAPLDVGVPGPSAVGATLSTGAEGQGASFSSGSR